MTELLPGTVTLVGGGPGDPDLITVAGLRAVRQADVIVYDRLAPRELLDEAKPDALRIDAGKHPYGQRTEQADINAMLIEHARAGHRVVRLKGGDNFVFGRGGEEWLACSDAGVPVSVIPGVSSAVAVPAAAGIPLTHRTLSQGVTIVSGHVAPGDPRSTLDWDALASTHTTLVILMGVTHLEAILDALRSGGINSSTAAAVVMRAYRPDMQIVRGTVGDLAKLARAADVRPPAITVVGDVAGLSLLAGG